MLIITILLFVTKSHSQNNSSQWLILDSEYPLNYILCSTIDNNGSLWFGSEFSYVIKYENDTWTNYDLFCGEIVSLDIDTSNNLWIGSDGCELTKFNGTNFETFSPIPDSAINARTVLIDNDDNIWMGSFSGTFRYSDSSWTQYDTSNSSLASNWVTSMAYNSKNQIWGKSWKYLVFFDDSVWHSFSEYYPPVWDQSIAIDSNEWYGLELGPVNLLVLI